MLPQPGRTYGKYWVWGDVASMERGRGQVSDLPLPDPPVPELRVPELSVPDVLLPDVPLQSCWCREVEDGPASS